MDEVSRAIDAAAHLADRARGARRLRRFEASRRLNRLADALYHAQLVEESFRFTARELVGRCRPSLYQPRGRTLAAVIRHRTGDLYVLNEIVRHGCYTFPTEVAERLTALDHPPRVLDAGANIGLFGIEVFSRFPEAFVTAFEPDPANAAILEEVVRINGLEHRWKVIRSCVGTADGTASFTAEGSVGSRVGLSPDSIEVGMVDLFPYLPEADLLKMDIEGSEWPILSDARLSAVADLVLVLEYHEGTSPFPNAREAVLRLLSEAGFTTREIDVPRQPAGTGIVWGWN